MGCYRIFVDTSLMKIILTEAIRFLCIKTLIMQLLIKIITEQINVLDGLIKIGDMIRS